MLILLTLSNRGSQILQKWRSEGIIANFKLYLLGFDPSQSNYKNNLK